MDTLLVTFTRRIGNKPLVDTDLDDKAFTDLKSVVASIVKETECPDSVLSIIGKMLNMIQPMDDVLEVQINQRHRVVFHGGHVSPRTLQRYLS